MEVHPEPSCRMSKERMDDSVRKVGADYSLLLWTCEMDPKQSQSPQRRDAAKQQVSSQLLQPRMGNTHNDKSSSDDVVSDIWKYSGFMEQNGTWSGRGMDGDRRNRKEERVVISS